MKCNNCGAELKEGERFCAVCGQPVDSEQEGRTEQSVNEEQMGNQMAETVRKPGFLNNKIIITVAITCVLIVGIVAGAAALKKFGMSPAEYYQYVETKNRDEHLENLTKYYESAYGGFSGEAFDKKINMKLTLADHIKSLASLYGLDLSKLDNIELDAAVKKEENAYSSIIKAGANGEGLVTLKSHYNLDTKDSYVQIPELSEAYIHASMDSSEAEANKLYSFMDVGKMIPDVEDLKKIYKRYTDLVIDHAKNVEKAEGESKCELQGVSCKADLYTVTMDGKEAVSLADDIFKQLKEDNEIKNFIGNIDEEAGGKYEEEIGTVIEDIEKEGDTADFSIVMEVQVGDDDKIIGRNIKVKDDTEEITVRMLSPRDGENFAWEIAVESKETEIFNFHGKGTEKDSIINGDFAADIALSSKEGAPELTKNVLMVTLEDYDVSKLKEGEVRGTVIYSTEAMAELANYSLRVEAEGNQKEATGVITVLAGKEAVAAIDMKMESGAKIESVEPSESDKVYEADNADDMSKYQSELNIMQLLQKVQDTLGINFSSLMGLM